MKNIDFFTNTTKAMWGSYGFQALFYLGMIIIVIMEQKKSKKSVWFWYPICILLIIYNPFMYHICKYIFGSGQNLTAYYCRLFCLIPIVFIIAYAFVLVLKRTSRWKKMGCTFLLLAVLILCGHSAYGENWFIRASNVNKVPTDIIQLCELFQDQDISIMVPTDLVAYMRQMYSGFHMPYGRFREENISNQLQSEAPNVKEILSYALRVNTDYIVTIYNDELLSQYTSLGCEIIGFTNKYVVLKQHYPKWILTQYADATGNQAMFYTLENTIDSSLLVIDGGWSDNATQVRNVILEKGGIVDFWILTHYHPDHIGAFNTIYQDPQGIEINHIYTTTYDVNLLESVAQEWDDIDTFYCFKTIAATTDNITYIERDTTIEYDDMEITFFNCWDTLLQEANPGDIFNNSSLVFKIVTAEDSILFCSDCHGTVMADLLIEKYGSALQAEYVQLGHHENNSLPTEFYDWVEPIGVLFDAPEWLMTGENYSAKDLAAYFEAQGIQCYDYRSAPNQIFFH